MKFKSGIAAALLTCTSLTTPAQAQEQVTLTWQMWGDERDSAVLLQLADLVTAKHPNIKVTPQISGWSDYWTRLPVVASSGEIADLVAMQSMRMPSFYPILEPLDPYIEADKLDVDAFEPSIMAAMTQDGTQYALPYDVGPWVVFYNRDKFEAAGLAEPALDWTFDNFRAAAKALTQGQDYGYASASFDFVAGPVSLGGDYFNADNQFDLTNPGYAGAVGKYVEVTAVDKSAPVFASGGGATATTSSGRFASGNAAMYIDGPWSLINVRNTVKFRMGVAPLPQGDGDPRFITAGSGWGISATSQHKEEAYQALKVLTGPDAARIMAEAGRALPGRLAEQSYWYDVAAKDVSGTRETLTYAFQHSIPFRLNEYWNDFENLLIQYMPLALNGDVTAEQALADIQNQLPM